MFIIYPVASSIFIIPNPAASTCSLNSLPLPMLVRELPACSTDCGNEEPNGFLVTLQPQVWAQRQRTRRCNTVQLGLHISTEAFHWALLVPSWFSAACFFAQFCLCIFYFWPCEPGMVCSHQGLLFYCSKTTLLCCSGCRKFIFLIIW